MLTKGIFLFLTLFLIINQASADFDEIKKRCLGLALMKNKLANIVSTSQVQQPIIPPQYTYPQEIIYLTEEQFFQQYGYWPQEYIINTSPVAEEIIYFNGRKMDNGNTDRRKMTKEELQEMERRNKTLLQGRK